MRDLLRVLVITVLAYLGGFLLGFLGTRLLYVLLYGG
jgi:hypothetical protein